MKINFILDKLTPLQIDEWDFEVINAYYSGKFRRINNPPQDWQRTDKARLILAFSCSVISDKLTKIMKEVRNDGTH